MCKVFKGFKYMYNKREVCLHWKYHFNVWLMKLNCTWMKQEINNIHVTYSLLRGIQSWCIHVHLIVYFYIFISFQINVNRVSFLESRAIVITRSSSSSCKNFNVDYCSKIIKGINTKLGILAHYDKVQMQGKGITL